MKLDRLLTFGVGAITLSFGQAATAADTTWTMTTQWPSAIELIEYDKHFVETANKLIGDELEIKFHPGGTLIPPSEVFDAASAGDIEASGDWPGFWAGRNSAFSPLATHTMMFNAADYMMWIEAWGGFEMYQEVYGEHGLVYLPHAVLNNESGFRTNEPIRSIEDLEGMRLRISGRDQGRVLERLGATQVQIATHEIYQALEQGVLDGAEMATPGIDYGVGYHEVTDYWLTPGWHQSATVIGVMINEDAWNALSENVQNKLKVAAQANMMWSLGFSEKRAVEGTQKFIEAGTEITRFGEEDLAKIQKIANEVIVESSCDNPLHGKVYLSQLSYLEEYSQWRKFSEPFALGRNTELPNLDEIEACIQDASNN
ncbi:TRAP transporter substrate-binding protein DctP [Fodinicurvata sediminis]|uniref:TRAP transporter substrate-binding protein DctP n=1 Tax=Fodinicurvata sediminis TaxID=1121832 RepID=UPI0003B56877|nr:TRAP transporter substrate-binding protein DctP [Fodinicurvata sediminis]